MALLLAITGALAYGIFTGCSCCGLGLAILWVIATVVWPILWGLNREPRRSQDYLNRCCGNDHEYFWDEKEAVVAWHGDVPIWGKVRAKRCNRCDHEEEKVHMWG